MSASELYDLIIVGGGPGGSRRECTPCGRRSRRYCSKRASSAARWPNTKGVENYPGFIEISGYDLSEKFHQHAAAYGLQMIQQEVVAVEPGLDFHTVQLADGARLYAHAVILAAGGSARLLNVPGENEITARACRIARRVTGSFLETKPWSWWAAAIPRWKTPCTWPRSLGTSPSSIGATVFAPAASCSKECWRNPRLKSC